MDDFIILDSDLEKLKEAKEKIVEKLEMEYKLKVNGKKNLQEYKLQLKKFNQTQMF